ncbi:MAG TPA: heme-binding protein [Stellaceae bacterium]|nr:heme-binding protein [Stellaceae bacterium]
MKVRILTMLAFGMALIASGAQAQQAAPGGKPAEAVPAKLPFDIPYGAPISLERARHVIAAAEAEARKRKWAMNCAVLDSGANLVSFDRMDGAQLGSIAIAEHKARAAVKFRRPTAAIEDGLQKHGAYYLMTLDDMIASRGGVPLVEGGKLIGAIGCSGGIGPQDELVATAGADVVNKK